MVDAKGRRLSAVLLADIAGYTKLVEQDTDGTVSAWTALRSDVIIPTVSAHAGQIVKYTGDGFLAEFSSVQNAVECAISMQSDFAKSSLGFRIGIGLGDVVDDGMDIHGEGVNIAARIEALAEQGDICVAAAVRDAVKNRVATMFEDMGEHVVKHVSTPVRIYRIAGEHNRASKVDDVSAQSFPEPSTELASGKPSIAVLPFGNLSGDPGQDYFADGVVEEIITALARLSWLFVIARNSSFIYKGQAVDIKQVGRDLGVRYVLEGSIRKAGNRIRMTGQLIDAGTGAHLWADRYDGNLDDIFELQDQMTSNVVGAIAPRLEAAEIERTKHKPTNSLDAYDCYLRGMAGMYKWSPADIAQALSHFYRAIEIDPEFGIAYAMAARCMNVRAVTSPLEFCSADVAEAERLCRLAAELGRNDAMALCMTGVTLGFTVRDVPGGAALTARALALNPNLAAALFSDGWLQQWLGNPETAIRHIGRAMELSPQDPTIFQMQSAMAGAYFTSGDDAQALAWAERALYDRPGHFPALCWARWSVLPIWGFRPRSKTSGTA